ncbi:hypothetical protein GDO81_009711 [Engystomops pustulosus]|uniref:Uncharacterized protein n=1 Tax=Engystomops pustulosus TaxID=76066 RepID=A0AAV7BTZ0_ENGPU|nr:hypothetical protein GDO81_009711 [Engystomops pustulosus]
MSLRALFRMTSLQHFPMFFVTGLLIYYAIYKIYETMNEERTNHLQLYVSNEHQSSSELDCFRVISGDGEAVTKAQLYNLHLKKKRKPITENDYLNITQDCIHFKTTKDIPFSLRRKENFPMPISMVIHGRLRCLRDC